MTCRGGSLSPKAIVRVGGGGSLLEPSGFRSLSPLDGEATWERLGRGGATDGGGSSSGEILFPRRRGSGGGDANCLRLWAEVESKVDSRTGVTKGWGLRGGGRGGGTRMDRGAERDTRADVSLITVSVKVVTVFREFSALIGDTG